jgi:hypothetical protein
MATAVSAQTASKYGVTTVDMSNLVSAPRQMQQMQQQQMDAHSKMGNSVPSAPLAPVYPAVPTVAATWSDFPDQPRTFAGVQNFEIGEATQGYYETTQGSYAPLLDFRHHHPDDSITSEPTRDPSDNELRKGERSAMQREHEEDRAIAASRVKAKQLSKSENRAADTAIQIAARSAQKGFQVRDPHAHLLKNATGAAQADEKDGREHSKSDIVLDKSTGEPKVESDDEGDFRVNGEYEVQEYKMGEYESEYEYKSMYD